MQQIRFYLFCALWLFSSVLCAQTIEEKMMNFAEGISYKLESQVSTSRNATPLWLTANKHGVSNTRRNFGYFRPALIRETTADSTKNWRFGFGLDAVVGYGLQRELLFQQYFVDVAWKKLHFTLGAKERDADLKPKDLSTGGQTLGVNARPIPQIRIDFPDYVSISGKERWLSVKGHVAYGILTDDKWQEDYVADGMKRNENVIFHSKAGFLKIGNEHKFPLTLEGGLEMVCTFGGKAYNVQKNLPYLDLKPSFKDYIDAFFAQGSDVTDGVYSNAAGNTFGSWLFRLNYHGKDWRLSAYYDHFFEDHSALFFEYGWFDGLIGLELELPKNRFVSNVVFELMKTTYQSGPIYHDATPSIPDQISGVDKYYYNEIYQGPQHWGQALGNPLFVSPLYMNDGSLQFPCTRFYAQHLGIKGNPHSSLSYRLLYTHSYRLGTYYKPLIDKVHFNSFLCELNFSPAKIKRCNLSGWSATIAFAMDRGGLIGNNAGFQFTLRKTGWLSR